MNITVIVAALLIAWAGVSTMRAASLKREVVALKEEKQRAQSEVDRIKREQVQANVQIAKAYTGVIETSDASRSASRDELGRLRIALTKAPSCSASAAAASRADAAAIYTQIIGECAATLQTVGEAALSDRDKLEALQGWVARNAPPRTPQ